MPTDNHDLETQRLELEKARLRYEQSFPRKWGGLMIGLLLPLTTLVGGWWVKEVEIVRQSKISDRAKHESAAIASREKAQQDSEKEKQIDRLDREKAISSARTTLELYFKHSDLMDVSKPRAFENLSMLAEISGLESVRTILRKMAEKMVVADRDSSRSSNIDSKAPSELLQGLPDLVKPTKGLTALKYDLSKFTAYMQTPKSRRDDPKVNAAIGSVRGVLKDIGMRVPDPEFVRAAPNQNEIRIYLPEHRVFAEEMARTLSRETGELFAVKELAKKGLPDGVLEIWMKD